LFPLKSAAASPNPPFIVDIQSDRPYYKKGEIVNLNIQISKSTTSTVPPLRVYIALKDASNRTIAFRNRYLSIPASGIAKTSASFNTANLKMAGNIYPVEIIIFGRGTELQRSGSFIVFAEKPKPLSLVLLLKLSMPYRLSHEKYLISEEPLKYLSGTARMKPFLDSAASGKIPIMLAVSNSTLIQLDYMSKPFSIKRKDGQVESFGEGSTQVRSADQLRQTLKKLIASKNTNTALYPYGDLNLTLLEKTETLFAYQELLDRAKKRLEAFSGAELNPQFIFLPRSGISVKVVGELSKNGYAIVCESNDNTKKNSGLYENTILLFSQKYPSGEDPVEVARRILESHLRSETRETIVFDISDADFAKVDKFLSLISKFDFIRITSKPPFYLEPLSKIEEKEADYENFNNLAHQLIKRFKETKSLVEAYLSSFAVEEEEKNDLDSSLYDSLLFAFNKSEDYDTAFYSLKEIREKIDSDFRKISVSPAVISFTTTRAQLPISVINKTSKPVKCVLILKANGIKFLKNNRKIVLNASENVYSVPIVLQRSGNVPVTVELRTPDNTLISKGKITVRSNFRLILVSALLFVFLLLALLLTIRLKLRKKSA
jgi:hypothetical protein